ncbi:hypothetical protein ACF3NG_03310 [Aerococcaceae bacterium WGS1372]
MHEKQAEIANTIPKIEPYGSLLSVNIRKFEVLGVKESWGKQHLNLSAKPMDAEVKILGGSHLL